MAAFVPTTRLEAEQWLLRFFSTADSLDVSKLPTVYAHNIKLKFGNSPVIHGLDAVTKHFDAIWLGLNKIHHEREEFDMVGNDKIYQSSRISFRVKNDPETELVEVPAMAVFHLVTSGDEAGLIRQCEFYLDASPLLAAFARAG